MIGNAVAGFLAGGVSGSQPPIASPFSWYDAADLTTISTSGSSVTQWNDKGTNAANLTQATGANQPTSGVTTLNGKNVITFDGADNLANSTLSKFKFLSDGTVYIMGIVVKASSSSNPGTYNMVFTNIRSAEGVTGRSMQFEDRVPSHARVYINNGATSVVSNTTSNNSWPSGGSTPIVYTELTDPSNGTAANRSYVYFNSGSAYNANGQTGTPSSSNGTYTFAVGATDQSVAGITGYIGEILIYTGAAATESNRVIVRNYLQTKWGL